MTTATIGEEARGTALEARLAADVARRRRAARGEPRGGHAAARRAAVNVARVALQAHDRGTSAHSDDVVVLCRAIAERLEIRGRELDDLIATARLHDIGKVAVPTGILEKPGPLDDGEWATMREHTMVGEEILSSVHELQNVAHVVRSCHERYDGAGYPDGLAGEEIPHIARVVFCADAFHAMREDRPYRRGRSAAKALAELRRNAGTQFDPRVVDALEDAARELRQAGPSRLGTLSAPLRSRRLMALLATMTIGGTAFAATGGYLPLPFAGSQGADDAPASVVRSADCSQGCDILALGPLGQTLALPAARAEGASLDSRHGRLARGVGLIPGFAGNGAPGLGAERGQGSPGPTGAAPDRSGDAPGHDDSPGRSGDAPGHDGSPGQSGDAPGHGGSSPGHSGEDRPAGKAPKVKLPKVKLPNVNAPKVESPKVKAPKVKAPKAEAPKAEAPKSKAPKPDDAKH